MNTLVVGFCRRLIQAYLVMRLLRLFAFASTIHIQGLDLLLDSPNSLRPRHCNNRYTNTAADHNRCPIQNFFRCATYDRLEFHSALPNAYAPSPFYLLRLLSLNLLTTVLNRCEIFFLPSLACICFVFASLRCKGVLCDYGVHRKCHFVVLRA